MTLDLSRPIARRRSLTVATAGAAVASRATPGWPRTVETLSEPGFIAARRRSLEIFQREVRR